MVVDVAKEYAKTPGGRFQKDGPYSGEDFRERVLLPRFLGSLREGEALVVVLDGGYGYSAAFLEEAFGGLARNTKDPRILKTVIVSEEEPRLIADIKGYMEAALGA